MIPVTKPYLPDKQEYFKLISGVFDRNWLTNDGPLVNELEQSLKACLDLEHLIYVGNGTLALQLAIKALKLSGEIITTPFSYVATTSSIVWEQCTPVFVDIKESDFNIDPSQIEGAITENTSAILATHCFGNACDVEAIQKIADKYSLKVIYDAAHAFGTQYQRKSIMYFGDISCCSLHATKMMHSIEGGIVVTKDPDLLKSLAYLRNFGHDGPERFNGLGINAKNSEFHAAMGLLVLNDFERIKERRKKQFDTYLEMISNMRVKTPASIKESESNNSYFPVVFESEEKALKAKSYLERHEIFPRRYFYPALNKLDYVKENETLLAESISSRILCLPLYHDLSKEEQAVIIRLLLRIQNFPDLC